MNPRDYQKAILETAKEYNTLVVLPTGVGKTLIALLLAVSRIEKYPGRKVLFLAPTKPLVEQHAEYFKKNLSELFAEMQTFTGEIPASQRKKLWQTSEIIFSTPQCVANDLSSYLYDLKDVSTLIIDEAHRCLKNYDYTKVVGFYKRQGNEKRILGLTASPGSELDKVKEICNHLDIEKMEIRTRDSEDVKPYLQELDFNKIEVDFPEEFKEIQILLKRIYSQKTDQLRERSLLFGPANKITLLKLQSNLAKRASMRDYNAMVGMSICAQAIKILHASELLETQTLFGLKNYLDELVKQANERKSKAVQTLCKSPEFNAAMISLSFLTAKNIEHPKIEKIKELIDKQFEKENSKIIVFTQFRETATTIIKKLSENPKIKAKIFVGQAKKKDTGLSQKEQKRIIEEFREGKINVLCSTSIGEEGLDIPEVNAVYFYEPISSAIRKIQRAGRTARLAPGSLFILITKNTKDEIHHYSSSAREKKMYRTIETMKKELGKKNLKSYL